MINNDFCVILDRAHGINVLGKQSPDGRHREWEWSDGLVNRLKPQIEAIGLNYFVYPETAYVPTYVNKQGIEKELISYRVKRYNALPYKYKLVLSFHNDATSIKDWTNQTGWSMWTKKGADISDLIAEKYLYPHIYKYNRVLKHRRYFARQLDNEANFTVLLGNYAAILIEWLMQNNKRDIELLKDTTLFEKSIIDFLKAIKLNLNTIIQQWEINLTKQF